MKVVEETFRQLLQIIWCLWLKQLFVYTDEDFKINSILPRFLSLILTGKNSYRRDRKGYSQRIFVSGTYPVYPNVVHNVKRR